MSIDDSDRLTFGESSLGADLDADQDASARPKRSRTVLYIGGAMAALALLGIAALAVTVLYWLPQQREQRMAEATGTVVALTRVAASWTATPTATFTPLPASPTPTLEPTQTPAPTPTSTRVVGRSPVEEQVAMVTATFELPATTPDAGLGVGGLAAAAVGLTALLAVARGVRGQE